MRLTEKHKNLNRHNSHLIKLVPRFHPPYSVFISYPDEDESFMETINAFLTFMDVTCHVAKHQRDAGEELWDKISPMINDSTRVLLLYTHFAPNSDWMRREITIARTFRKKFIPVKEKDVELPGPVRGEDREYIPFKRDNFIFTLKEICRQVYEYRNRTPHVFRFTTNNRDTGRKLIVTPWTGQAYWTDAIVDRLVETGKVEMTTIDIHPWRTNNHFTWAQMQGLELVNRPPRPEELGF